MNFSYGTLQLASLLDDRDETVAVNALAQLLAREDELGDLPGLLQESSDPLVRRRAHMLQNAISMRAGRRELARMINCPRDEEIFDALTGLHLLWYDRDQKSDICKEVDKFRQRAAKYPLDSLEDGEFFMRKSTFLPENETTIRPECYCIGTALFQKCAAASLWMMVLYGLLPKGNFQLVRLQGNYGLIDNNGMVLTGSGGWRLMEYDGNGEMISVPQLMRYFGTTLLSCAVNSDSYRYVMSITQVLTGDESEKVLNSFPYPFGSKPGR